MARDRIVMARLALVDSMPVMVGYVTMGFVAGVLLAAKGGVTLAPLWALLTSLGTVSGTFSFAVVMPVSHHASLWSIALLTACINFRYLFYGISFIDRWRGVRLLPKWLLVHMLTDENYALEASCIIPNERRAITYCVFLSLFNLCYWVLAVLAGAVCVALLQKAVDPDVIRARTAGMEFAMVALYIVVFVEQARGFMRHGR